MKILGCTEQTSETTLGKRNKKLNKQYSNQIFQLTISVGENSYFGFAQLGNSLAYNKVGNVLRLHDYFGFTLNRQSPSKFI